jgi:hypothetical protein
MSAVTPGLAYEKSCVLETEDLVRVLRNSPDAPVPKLHHLSTDCCSDPFHRLPELSRPSPVSDISFLSHTKGFVIHKFICVSRTIRAHRISSPLLTLQRCFQFSGQFLYRRPWRDTDSQCATVFGSPHRSTSSADSPAHQQCW